MSYIQKKIKDIFEYVKLKCQEDSKFYKIMLIFDLPVRNYRYYSYIILILKISSLLLPERNTAIT